MSSPTTNKEFRWRDGGAAHAGIVNAERQRGTWPCIHWVVTIVGGGVARRLLCACSCTLHCISRDERTFRDIYDCGEWRGNLVPAVVHARVRRVCRHECCKGCRVRDGGVHGCRRHSSCVRRESGLLLGFVGAAVDGVFHVHDSGTVTASVRRVNDGLVHQSGVSRRHAWVRRGPYRPLLEPAVLFAPRHDEGGAFADCVCLTVSSASLEAGGDEAVALNTPASSVLPPVYHTKSCAGDECSSRNCTRCRNL